MTRRKKSDRRFVRTYIILAVIALCLTWLGVRTLFAKPQPTTLHTLALLRVPKETPTIYLPGPYEAAEIISPVLGAETISPSDIVLYINNERIKRGAPPLRENAVLTKAAQMRTDVIMKYQNFSHQDPYEHIQLDTVLPMVHYPFVYATENIGMGDFSAQAFVNGFMNSTAHRENLLNPKLRETGVALATGPYKQYYVNIAVQLFAIPTTQNEYLGYSEEEIQQYKKLLADLASQISLTRDLINRNVGNKEYYEGWQKILIRQQVILSTLYDAMVRQQPFINNFVSLIREYNTNWNRVPKPASG